MINRSNIVQFELPPEGRPVTLHLGEALKVFKDYDTSREILLACMIVSGALDTSIVLRAEARFNDGAPLTAEEETALKAFQRLWASPTEAEREEVMMMALEIVFHGKLIGSPFVWNRPTQC